MNESATPTAFRRGLGGPAGRAESMTLTLSEPAGQSGTAGTAATGLVRVGVAAAVFATAAMLCA